MSNNQELNFVVNGIDYSNSQRIEDTNTEYLDSSSSEESNDNIQPNEVDNVVENSNDSNSTSNSTNTSNNNRTDTDLERAIQASLQTQNSESNYTQADFDRELQEVLQMSKDEEQQRLNSIKSNTFSAPILPMSMLPENLFQYYTNINQSSNKY